MERLNEIIANPYIPRVALWVFMAVVAFSQTVDLRKQTEATPPTPLRVGTVVPGTCAVGERFYRTDAKPWMYRCTAPNKWEVADTEYPLAGGSRIWMRDEGAGGTHEPREVQSTPKHVKVYVRGPVLGNTWQVRGCVDDPWGQCLNLLTTFDITASLLRQIKSTSGVGYAFERSRYSVGILSGELFTNEEVANRVAAVVRSHLAAEKGKGK